MSYTSIVGEQTELADSISKAYEKLIAQETTLVRVETRLRALNNWWNKYQDNHAALWKAKYSTKTDMRSALAELPYFTERQYTAVEEIYLTAVEKMQELRERNDANATTGGDPVNLSNIQGQSQHHSEFKLERMDIPDFDGDFSQWLKFKGSFNQFVGANPSLTSMQKLYYLQKHLKGNAELHVRNTPLTGENFQLAWDSLVEYYDNKRSLINISLSILFNSPSLVKDSLASLEKLFADIKQSLNALEALDRPVKEWDDLIVYIVVKKLDSDTVREWERVIGVSTEPPTWAQLRSFLLLRIRTLQAYQTDYSGSTSSNVSKTRGNSVKSHVVDSEKSASKCILCNEVHYLGKCSQYQLLPVEKRIEKVREAGLCFNCLGHHKVVRCFSKENCGTCGGRHHTSIHLLRGNSSVHQTASEIVSEPSPALNTSANMSSHQASKCSSSAILATALVRIKSRTGELVEFRALVDPGSQITLVTEELAQRLRLQRRNCSHTVSGVGVAESTSARGIIDIELFSRWNKFVCAAEATILRRLTDYVPRTSLNQRLNMLDGLQLADPDFSSTRGIDIILGIDVYHLIIQPGLRKESPDHPIAQQTTFGWIISGRILRGDDVQNSSCFHLSTDKELTELVKGFWLQQEVFSDSTDESRADDFDFMKFYQETYSRDQDGRFCVRYPFKLSPSLLGDSRASALKMLNRLVYRLKEKPELFTQYNNFLEEYERLGHMTRLSSDCAAGTIKYFLTHHPVFRDTSLTTKLRAVFNGSWKTTTKISLNDILYEGPKVLALIFFVITRWRKFRYVFTADIKQMFRQILMHPEDRVHQGILWIDDVLGVIEFVLNTVTYGTKSAPCTAVSTVRQLANDEGDKYPAAKEILLETTYMDDIYGGADTLEECKSRIREVIDLCRAGCFPLQKWSSNDRSLLNEVTISIQEGSEHLIDDQDSHRTLGLLWNSDQDFFFYSPKVQSNDEIITKRILLSRVARIYDPLGWIAPFVVRGKIMVQNVWREKMSWDDPLADEFKRQWNQFSSEIQDLATVKVPRFLEFDSSTRSVELHGFSDSSSYAYGSVIYLKTTSATGEINITLLSSKSKLAPVVDKSRGKSANKIKVTIPRLELMAASLLVRHVVSLLGALNIKDLQINLWSDSSVALFWIKSDPQKYKQFVKNRVAEIQELLPGVKWRHVPGDENPADLVSRGVSAQKLASSALWWTGPPWLVEPESHWPSQDFLQPSTIEDEHLELRMASALASRNAEQQCWNLIKRFSDWKSLLAVTAWCQRVSRVFRERKEKAKNLGKILSYSRRVLLPIEIEEARIFWVKQTQGEYFAEEIESLRNTGQVARRSALFRLVPFLDDKEVIRLTGRLQKSSLEEDFKHPIILPSNADLTLLILRSIHLESLHGGVQLMLASLRRRYWILGGRKPVKAIIFRCVRCARLRAVTARQLMGQLPRRRVVACRPFLHTGVDYAGPLSVLTWRGRGAKTYKGFLVIFVCFTTSAVHIELATDYSTEGFLACYKRFTSRRGICETITSDCGTNLVGADKELRDLFHSASSESEIIAQALAKNGTQWIFNPPGSPHHGGKWEAAVKSIKFHLKRVMGDATLTYEELTTLLAQVEAVLNSRPLCELADDPDEFAVLTPGHFLIGSALNTVPEPSLLHLPESRLSRYQRIRKMLERIWEKWSVEYLQKLQEINKWHRESSNLEVGALVLIADERLPPTKWALGRIQQLHPGSDGLCRVVTIKTSTSVLKRPITKICPLPVEVAPSAIVDEHQHNDG